VRDFNKPCVGIVNKSTRKISVESAARPMEKHEREK